MTVLLEPHAASWGSTRYLERLHHACTAHDSFGLLKDFSRNLDRITLLKFREEELHR
jgi:hypothetical protein